MSNRIQTHQKCLRFIGSCVKITVRIECSREKKNMYRYNENHHREARLDRRIRVFYGSLILLVLVVASAAYLYIKSDLGGQTLGSQGSARVIQDEIKAYFETKYYSFEAPEFWVEAEDEDAVYDKHSYFSATQGEEARTLDVYVNELPHKVGANRVVRVTTTRNEIQPIDRSPQCITLQDKDVSDFLRVIVWEDVEFKCEPSRDRHVLIAASKEDGMGLKFGPQGDEFRLFFVYTDHTGKEDYTIFDDILESVEVLR